MKNYFDFAGYKGRQVTFIMTDSEVKKEEFREYINMILSTGSLVGQKFRERARKFPAIFNECTIDWFLPCPEEALSVAESFIKNFKGLETTAEVKIELFKHIGTVYLMVFVTPKSFLNYLNSIKISICLNSVNWIS